MVLRANIKPSTLLRIRGNYHLPLTYYLVSVNKHFREEKLEIGEKRAEVQDKHEDQHTVFFTGKNGPKHEAK